MTPRVEGRSDLMPRTLDLLIPQTLAVDSLHGYAIATHVERRSEEVLRVEQGSLYPALDRLRRKGWVTSEWRVSVIGRRAPYYTLMASGRERLQAELARYDRVSLAIARVLRRA